MEVKQTLVEFLEDELPSYSNAQGVQLYLNTDSSVFFVSYYPGFEQLPNTNLEIFQEYKSVKRFLSVLELSRLEQLLTLTPADLLGLFDQGKMNIICSLGDNVDYELTFKKYKGKLWARDMHEKKHLVKVPISEPKEFIDYTVACYQLIDNKQRTDLPTNHSNSPIFRL